MFDWGWGERGGDYVRHLVRIWGELQNFDKNFFHLLSPTAPQIVPAETENCQSR